MTHFRQVSDRSPAWRQLRSGVWLTAERARVYTLILLAFYAIAIAGWIALSGGLTDPNGKPIGTDFSSFYAAGSLVHDGRAADVYDMAAHYAREKQIFGEATPYYGWLYPPMFLLVVTPLALMPYPLALAVWQGATFALYLTVIAAILRRVRNDDTIARLWLPVSVAFPAAFINLGHGQNGFLTAGLFGAALVTLPKRPLLAGVLFGLLCYKPQFGLLIPFALLAGGQWRTFLAACITVIVLAGASYLAFGPEVWRAFAASTETSRTLLLEQGNVGFEKLQSVFAAVRMWGGGVSLAYVVQATATVIALVGVAWTWNATWGSAWHSNRLSNWRATSDSNDSDLKAALLIVATLLASPHVLDYDLTVLAPAIAFIVASRWPNGFRDYDVSALAAVWVVPLFGRAIAGTTGVPLGLTTVVMLYILVLRHVVRRRSVTSLDTASIAQA
jgi:alpha-1,2-mannosyltransferase